MYYRFFLFFLFLNIHSTFGMNASHPIIDSLFRSPIPNDQERNNLTILAAEQYMLRYPPFPGDPFAYRAEPVSATQFSVRHEDTPESLAIQNLRPQEYRVRSANADTYSRIVERSAVRLVNQQIDDLTGKRKQFDARLGRMIILTALECTIQ